MIIRFLIKIVVSFIPSDLLQRGIRTLAAQKSRSSDPKSGLKFLGELDRSLYHLQGDLAGTYGEGVHVKHRLTGSYEFFTDRISASNTVLDIGCGNGALAYSIAKTTNANVIGIDINPKTIEKAKVLHSHKNVQYVTGDATKKTIENNFDVVVLSNVLEHIEQRVSFLKDLISNTKAPTFLIRVPSFDRDWRVPLKKELGIEWRLDVTHEIEYTVDIFLSELSSSGMEAIHLESKWGEIWSVCKPC